MRLPTHQEAMHPGQDGPTQQAGLLSASPRLAPSQRRLSRILAAATLASAGLLVVTGLWLPGRVDPALPLQQDPMLLTSLLGVPAFAALYMLNRAGHYRSAAAAYVFVVFDLTWLFTLLIQATAYDIGNYAYLVFPVIVASVFLHPRLTALYAGLNFAGVAALHAWVGLTPAQLWLTLAYLLLFSTLLLVTASMRERDHAHLETQSEELERRVADSDAIMANADAGIVGVDRQGNAVAWNEPAQQLFRDAWSVPLRRGAPVLAGLPGRLANPIQEALEGALSGRRTVVEAVSSGDAPRHYEVAVQPIRLRDGRIAGATASCRDVTERRMREQERMQAYRQEQELESLRAMDAFKTRLLNLASHELNTPLTPIRLQVHLMRSRAGNGMDMAQLQSLDVVDRNLRRLGSLVQDILDAVRLEQGGFAVHHGPLELTGFLADACNQVAPEARSAGVDLQVEPGAEQWIRGDAPRLARGVRAILVRAVQGAGNGATVRARVVPAEDGATIEVEGPGALPEGSDAEALFQAFGTAEGQEGTRAGGSGLDLYVCRGMATAHGGDAGCRQAKDGAVVYWMRLPSGQDAM